MNETSKAFAVISSHFIIRVPPPNSEAERKRQVIALHYRASESALLHWRGKSRVGQNFTLLLDKLLALPTNTVYLVVLLLKHQGHNLKLPDTLDYYLKKLASNHFVLTFLAVCNYTHLTKQFTNFKDQKTNI